MSNNHDNTIESQLNLIENGSHNDLISFENELLDGARVNSGNTETVDIIERGLRETDNVFNELQEVASRLAAHISPIESFNTEREIELLRVDNIIDIPMRAESSRNNPREDRGVTFRDMISDMITNTTTSVVTTVPGMPPLYSLVNHPNMNNLNQGTQNPLRGYEELGDGNFGQESQHPFQGAERPIQDSTQYRFLGLREPGFNNQYSSSQFQPEGATGQGHAYSSNEQQYPITGGTKPKTKHQDPRLPQNNNYNYLEVQQAINTHFPSAVRDDLPAQKVIDDKMLWLEQMLQWQTDEQAEVFKWVERDFEEVDELRLPTDLIELKRMALEQLEEMEEKCKELEETYARECLGKVVYARQQSWQRRYRMVRSHIRCSRAMIRYYTEGRTGGGERDPDVCSSDEVQRDQIPVRNVSCQPAWSGPQGVAAVAQPVAVSQTGNRGETTLEADMPGQTRVETAPRFFTTEEYRNHRLSTAQGHSVTAETVPVISTPAGSREPRPPVLGTNHIDDHFAFQRPLAPQNHSAPEIPNPQRPPATQFVGPPEFFNNQGPSAQQNNNLQNQQFLPRNPAIPMPGVQEFNRVHGHYDMQPAIWPGLYHNDIQIQLAMQAQRQQELARQSHETQMNQALEIAKMAQQGNACNSFDKFTRYENMSFPKFGGKHTEYQAFRTDFDSRMVYAKIPERVKGCYLYGALEGAAKDYVGNTGTWVNRYAELWAKLDSRYANRWTLAAETIKATLISEVPKGSIGNHADLVRYIDQQVNMIESIGQLDLTPQQLAVNTLLMKLPEFIAEPIRNGLRIRRKGTKDQEDFKFTPEEFAEVVNDTVLNMDKLYPKATSTTVMQTNVSHKGGVVPSKGSGTQSNSSGNHSNSNSSNKGNYNHNANNNNHGNVGHSGGNYNGNHNNGSSNGSGGFNFRGNSRGGYRGNSRFQGSSRPLKCYICQGEHYSADCTKYTTPHAKRDALIAQNRCPGCARAPHFGDPCELYFKCRVCKNAKHYDYLCIWKEPESNK